jgi:hypothetical protein
MKYSLSAPFLERCFDLAAGDSNEGQTVGAGFVGIIISNSFMKRQFGKKLIESYFPRWELTHIVDSSRAHIPGHGTPTAILFGRNRRPQVRHLRAVMGIKAEAQRPMNPAEGRVWQSILRQIDEAGSESEYVTVADIDRSVFHSHPWSIGGGGASDLKRSLDTAAARMLGSKVTSIGFASFAGQDEVFIQPKEVFIRQGVPATMIKPFVYGEAVRDWAVFSELAAFAPYNDTFELVPLDAETRWAQLLWPYRTTLSNIVSFGRKTKVQLGDVWWGWYRWIPEKYRNPISVTFAAIATHNHFVLDTGGRVFKQSAPVIKLNAAVPLSELHSMLTLLNSSVGCFWMKQQFHNKGGGGIGGGLATEAWEQFFDFDGTKLRQFPLPREMPTPAKAEQVSSLARKLAQLFNREEVAQFLVGGRGSSTVADADRFLAEAVSVQEEIDWESYKVYGLLGGDQFTDAAAPPVHPGERAFEILLARKFAEIKISIKHSNISRYRKNLGL